MDFSKIVSKIFWRSADKVGQLPIVGKMPEFEGVGPWLNSSPLNREELAGKVILVDFWTYSCVNCLRTIPYVNAWHDAYSEHGLVIIGIHTPEFEFEKSEENVQLAISRLGIKYPVALDNQYKLWHRYRNHYWPAHYFADIQGNLRAHHFGEGGYGHSEMVIRQLLKEAGREIDSPLVSESVVADVGQEGASTPETYLGYNRMEYLGSPEGIAMDRTRHYSSITDPTTNIFYLDGQWELKGEYAVPQEAGARITYRVVVSQINMVMVGPKDGARVLVRLDDRSLTKETKGSDCEVNGGHSLIVKEGRMYNIVNLKNKPAEHLIEITFLDPGVHVYSFTFG